MGKKLALVTGVGRKVGIAAAIAKQLAANDWDLALTYWTHYDERMRWGVEPADPLSIKEQLECTGASCYREKPDCGCAEQYGGANRAHSATFYRHAGEADCSCAERPAEELSTLYGTRLGYPLCLSRHLYYTSMVRDATGFSSEDKAARIKKANEARWANPAKKKK